MPAHLIHIGFYKAGSTFLQHWFARHPQLRYEPGAIGGFHDVYQIARGAESDCKYYVTSAEELASPHPEAGMVPLSLARRKRVSLPPAQKRQAAVCAALGAMFPGSRILMVTRGFRSLEISGYSQYLKAGGIQRVPSHLPAGDPPDPSRPDPFLHRDFDYLVRLYSEEFGAENLVVLPYELLRDDQERFLATLEERLGLDHVEVEIGRPNPSLSPEEMYWYPVISSAVSAVALRLGEKRFQRIYTRYVRLTMRNGLRPVVKLLSRLLPGRKVTPQDFPAASWTLYAGRAESLRSNPLYAPYAAEYLWTERPRAPGPEPLSARHPRPGLSARHPPPGG